MHSVSSYIIVFYYAVFFVVGITDDEILDRVVTGLKPET